jgi:hypothetical protein
MFRHLWTSIRGWMALGLTLATVATDGRPGFAQAVSQNLWAANGPVNAVVRSGNTIYIGGGFTRLGPATGGGVPIDAVTASFPANFPKIAGGVKAVAADGSGGWFVGGYFTSVNGVPRGNLVHILADNSLDPWNPNADSIVTSITVSGSLVYVGGGFAHVGGQPRSKIAALDASSGLATAWDPNAGGGLGGGVPTLVKALAVSGGIVYVGGNFTTIGGQTRNRIAALDAATGLATTWNPNAGNWPSFPGPSVEALAVSGSTVFCGGFFTTVGGQTRNALAALDASTGLATTWNPNVTGTVSALAVSGTTLYAGGDFTQVSGLGRGYIAAMNTFGTGGATFWNPSATSVVWCLAVNGTTVYAGGSFTTIGGQPRNGIAALSASTGLATAWNPSAGGAVFALTVSGSSIFAGGSLSSLGGQDRNRLAALDAASGALTAWNPNANNTVNSLSVSGGLVYAGGAFTSVGGQPRSFIAALDEGTGLATAWNPNANSFVNALAIDGGTVYAGGFFSTIGGQPRNRIAALDGATGLAIGWDPNANNTVYALQMNGSSIYVGGVFSSIGGQARNSIAELVVATGAATSWNPGADNLVSALALGAGTIYAGGDFTHIGGQTRSRIAALDAGTGLATAWNPSANSTVRALAVSGNVVYAGGDFTTIGGQTRNRIAAFDAASGLAAAWNPDASDRVSCLAVNGATVHAGGNFLRLGPWAQASIGMIAAMPGLSAIAPPNSGNAGSVTVSVAGSGVPPSAGIRLSRSGESDIPGTDVAVAADGSSLTATFDLMGAAAGAWDVVVTTPDLQTASLPGGFTVDAVLGVGDPPLVFGLEKIWPNPSSRSVAVTYSLPRPARIRLGVFDLAGRRRVALIDQERPAGRHTITWDSRAGRRVAGPGIYFVRYETPVGIWERRIALIH